MHHLFSSNTILQRIFKKSKLLICLDYDGTLTPIVRDPQKAQLPPRMKKILAALRQIKRFRIFIVSGRSLRDLKRRVGLRGITYMGNHGLEIQAPKLKYVHPAALVSRPLMRSLSGFLQRKLRGIQGARVENKVLSLSVHYRNIPERKIAAAKKIFKEAVKKSAEAGKIKLAEGKKVWEVHPNTDWNKGEALRWFFAKSRVKLTSSFPVYLGDDKTDENAFRFLRSKGLGIKVVKHPREASFASFYLRSPEEVFTFLEALKNGKMD